MIEFDSTAIGRAMPVSNWISAMEEAFTDTLKGVIDVPQRIHVENGDNMLLFMPCFGREYFSTKLVSVFPENMKRGRPIIYGTVILNDGSTGEPLATFDGAKLTAMRTAAVGSVGIKYLSPSNVKTLGIIGLGIQGLHQALFACQQRPVKELRIFDSSEKSMKLFRERFRAFYPDMHIILCKNTLELCRKSDIIITATSSKKPVIPAAKSCWEGKTIIGIGSYKPDMKEFPDALFKAISQLFVDTRHGISESGDLSQPLSKNLIDSDQIISLGEVIGRRVHPQDQTKVFKSVGMAAFDLYAAILIYKNREK
jgi:ornithine cyclodeaminase/alanine dehydrogenase-like protein (mu-crystallin family)